MRICGAAINSQYFAGAGHALHLKFDQPVAPTQWTSYFFHSRLPVQHAVATGTTGGEGSGKHCTFLNEPFYLPNFDATKSIGEVQQI